MRFVYQLNVTLDQELATKLHKLSDSLGYSISEIARRLIAFGIDEPKALIKRGDE